MNDLDYTDFAAWFANCEDWPVNHTTHDQVWALIERLRPGDLITARESRFATLYFVNGQRVNSAVVVAAESYLGARGCIVGPTSWPFGTTTIL